jgi:hypothetical protein
MTSPHAKLSDNVNSRENALLIIKTTRSRDLYPTTKCPKDKKHKLGCCENHAHTGK